ncbi:MAG: hypothetical protein KDI36_11005 [Pseudomonadales bacterium]|nr:hypothetical protein [Pseudomonadales bacterium]
MPACGPVDARLLIVGLAPGLHGANRTGVPFTGDASGDWLFAALEQFQLTSQCRITNAVKCLPPANLPNKTELRRCSAYLQEEILRHQQNPGPVLVVLGGVAHKAVLRAMGHTAGDFPFYHGASTELGGMKIFASYHCSRYNTQTGRLTRDMFNGVFGEVSTVINQWQICHHPD